MERNVARFYEDTHWDEQMKTVPRGLDQPKYEGLYFADLKSIIEI